MLCSHVPGFGRDSRTMGSTCSKASKLANENDRQSAHYVAHHPHRYRVLDRSVRIYSGWKAGDRGGGRVGAITVIVNGVPVLMSSSLNAASVPNDTAGVTLIRYVPGGVDALAVNVRFTASVLAAGRTT